MSNFPNVLLASTTLITCLLSLDQFTKMKNVTSQNKSHLIMEYSFNVLLNYADILFRVFALIFISETAL